MEIKRDKKGRPAGLNWSAQRPDLGDSVIAERAWDKAEAAIQEADARVIAAREAADRAIAEIAAELKEAETATSVRELELGRYVDAVIADVGAARFELVTPTAVRFRAVDNTVTEWSAKDGWSCTCGHVRKRNQVKNTTGDPGVIVCSHVETALSRIAWRAIEKMSAQQRIARPTPVQGGERSKAERAKAERNRFIMRTCGNLRRKAIRAGKSEEEARVLAREAYAAAALEYDNQQNTTNENPQEN